MDFVSSKEMEIVIDIDRNTDSRGEVGNSAPANDNIGTVALFNVCGMPENVDGLARVENSGNSKTVDEISPGVGKNSKRGKGKPTSVKKSPKPPRPPRSLSSLDAADQKLIKELAELAMIKRAKIERMKALKKMRAAKALSTSSSSGGNLIAILFSIILVVVILRKGCQSYHGNKSAVSVGGSVESSTVDQRNMFSNGVPLTSIESPKIMQPLSGYSKS